MLVRPSRNCVAVVFAAVLNVCCVAQATDINSPANVGNIARDPELHLIQDGIIGQFPAYDWSITGGDREFFVRDETEFSTPFVIKSGAPDFSHFIDAAGSSGFGTLFPDTILSTAIPGRFLNLRVSEAGTAGLARMVAQGSSGAQFHLVHNNGPVNQRVLRIQNVAGITSFGIVKDDLASNLVSNALVIKNLNGNIGLKQGNPTHPLHLGNGAHCTAGGVWTNASSRELKQDIHLITNEQARDAVRALQPVGYRYKEEQDEQYVGFIAEDVPELVATKDRKSLAPMDIVAVLTKVVQGQDRQLEQERERNDRLEAALNRQQQLVTKQQQLLDAMNKRLAELEQHR